MNLSLVAVFSASCLAFGVSTVSGGGAGMLLLPLLSTALPALAVPAALTVGTATSTVSKLGMFRRSVRWDIARLFVPGAVPGVVLGVTALRYLNPLYLEVILGLFLLTSLPRLVRGDRPDPPSPAGHRAWLAATGFAAGLLSGLTGAVGLLFNRFYFRHGLSRDEVIATRAANELLLHLLKLGLYLSLGLLTGPVWAAGAAVAVGAVLGTWLARRWLRFLPEAAFRRVGYGAMVLSGAVMLVSAARSIQRTENLGARVALLGGGDAEISAYWTGGSVALEWEYDEGPAVEHEIRFSDLPPAVRAEAEAQRAGRPIIKVEAVWELRERSYEVYLNDHGRVVQLELPAP